MHEREFTSKRYAIVEALVEKFKEIDGTGDYLTDLGQNAYPRLKFWDEIQEWPYVCMSPGPERREYQGGGFKDRYMSVTVRCYVQEEDSGKALERLIEDLETVIEKNGRLAYLDNKGVSQYTRDILIISIDTDEGVLDPIGAGEILIQIEY